MLMNVKTLKSIVTKVSILVLATFWQSIVIGIGNSSHKYC